MDKNSLNKIGKGEKGRMGEELVEKEVGNGILMVWK